MKAIRLITVTLLLIIALLVAAATAVVTLIDPNDYKAQIRAAALEQAGVELDIAGEIGWSFYPWLALELNDVGVGYPDKPSLGRLARAEVSVSLPALLRGQLRMNRIVIDGLKLELVQSAKGNNWTADRVAAPPAQPPLESTAPADSSQTPVLEIEAIELRHGALTFTDQTSDSRIELRELDLTTGRVDLEQPIPLELSFALRQFVANQLQLSAEVKLDSDITLNLVQNHYRLDNLSATLKLLEGAAVPAALEVTLAAAIDARIDEQRVAITQLRLEADPLRLTGEIDLRDFSQPELRGSLQSNQFNPKQLLARLGQNVPNTADANALTRAAFKATVGGAAGTVRLEPLQLQLDDTTLDGSASLVLDSGRIALELEGDALNADRYLPPATDSAANDPGDTASAGSTARGAGWPREEIISLQPLRALNLSANLDLGSLVVSGITLNQPGLSVSAAGGVVRLTRFSSGLFAGRIDATARLDARKPPLRLEVKAQSSEVQIGSLLQALADTDAVAGRFDATLELGMSGQSIHAWVNSLDGTARLSMNEGVIKGIDVAQSLCQGINDLSALWIDAAQVDKTTPFADLSASLGIRNGVVSNRDLKAQLDAIALTGRGSINLPQQTLEYRLGLTIEDNLFNQTCSVNDRLEGVEIPVSCKGSFQTEPAKLCRLDTRFIGDLLKAEAKRKIEEKVGTQVEEKLKQKLGEEGTGLLKGLLGR
jgi:AsmA protein